MKTISGAAMLAACILPAVASAQDTTGTGTRSTRDSASARTGGMMMARFDSAQTITVTGATVVRIESVGAGGWNAGTGASGAAGSMGAETMGAGTTRTGTGSSTGMGGSTGAGTRTGSGTGGSTGTDTGSSTTRTGTGSSSTGTGTGSSTTGTTGGMSSTGSGAMGSTGGTMAAGGKGNVGTSINALVKSGSDSMMVTLAPAEYLATQQLMLRAGDVVDLKGVPMKMGAQTHLIATEITKGATTVQLRNKSTGAPVWSPAGGSMGRDSSSMYRSMPTSPRKDSTGVMNRTKRDSTVTPSTRRDTSMTTSPVRKP